MSDYFERIRDRGVETAHGIFSIFDEYLDDKTRAELMQTCRYFHGFCAPTAGRRKAIKEEDDRVRESVVSGQKRYPARNLYEGFVRHSLPHTFKVTHDGYMKPNGIGKEIYPNISIYDPDGHFDHGTNTYIGHFKFGKKHGKGEITYHTGDVYEGDLVRSWVVSGAV